MTDVPPTVEAGRDAWNRLKSRERTSWADWLAVARALAIGRAEAMKQAKANRPLGSKYNRLFGAWLRDNGLADVTAQERYRALRCVDNCEAIERWRENLTDLDRRRLNHPNAVWAHWKRSIKPARPSQIAPVIARRAVSAAEMARRGKPIFWPQDALRRAHKAMLESRSTDLLALARLALQAAIRNEGDLLALLPDESARPTPAQTAAFA